MEGGEGEPPPTSMGARPTRGRGRGRGQSAASAFITKFKVRKQTVQPSAGITSDAADIEAQAEALHARSSSSTTTTTSSATTPSTSSSAFSAPPSMAAAAARVVLGSPQLPTAPKSFMGKATFKVAKRNGQPMSVPTQPPTSPPQPPTSSRRTSTTSAKRPHTTAKRPPAPSPSPSPSPTSPPSPSSSTRSSLSSSTTLTSTFPFSSLASYSSSSVGLPAAPSPNSSSSSSSSPPSPLATVSPARGFSSCSSSSSHNGGRPPAYATSSFDSSALLSSPPPSTTSSSLSYGEFAYDEHVGQPLPRQNFAALLHGSPHPIGGGLMHRRSPPTSSAAEGGRKAKRKRKEESGGESEAASRREKERRGSTKAMDEVTEQSDDGPREEGTAMEGKRRVRDIHDRVEAEENEEEAEEEEEEGHEDEDEGESDKIGVWDSQARLSAETTALVLMAAYERYVFPFTPLHPLVMHEDSVRLCVGEGDDSASPLTINVNMALALACNVIGDVRRANQFYNRARQKVAPFFDTSDYTVAESLATMGYFAFGQGDMARVSYYVDLAASICREVGAYNSDTYTKCMLGTALDPMRSLEEKERTVADYHKKAVLYPYFERDRLHILEAAPSCLGGVKGPAKVQCLILTRIAGRCLGDCMVILAEFESRKRKMATEGSEELKSWEREIERLKWLDEESRYPVPPFFDARRHRDFMSSMRKLEETLDKPELMGKSFGETAIAFHMVLRAKYALLLSKDKESFDWALRFVDVLQEINVRLMSPGNIPAFQLLLDILLEFQRPDLVKQCLESVDSWVRLYPFAQGIARVYAQLARDMESVMPLSFDTSSSSSSSSSPPSSFSLRTAAITPSVPSPSQSALPSTSAPAPVAVIRGGATVRGHDRRGQRQQQEGMRELQMEQERRRQELLQLEPSAVVAHCRPVYAVGPQPQPQPPPPQPYADLALLGASAGTVTWPPMPTSVMRGPTSTTLEDEAERWLMQAEQDATAYAARGPPLPIHHHHQQIYAQQLRPPMIAAADPMMGLSMPLDIGSDGRTQQQPPPQMAAAAANSFMPTSPSSAVFYSSLVPLHPPHPPSPSALVHKTTSRRDNK